MNPIRRYPRSIAYSLTSVLLALGVNQAPLGSAEAPTLKLRACQYEDSVNCVWDAKHMGNGTGDSYLVKQNGLVIYVSHRVAHQLLLDS